MSGTLFLVAFALVGAALAWWVDVRLPALGAENMRAAIIHVGVSVAVAQLLVPAALHFLLDGSQTVALLAIFGIALPALTYSFLAAIWMIKLVRGLLGGLPH